LATSRGFHIDTLILLSYNFKHCRIKNALLQTITDHLLMEGDR
jgi:hypothetical protein